MIMSTLHSDGSAKFTVSNGDVDHKFTASCQDSSAILTYEETMLHRGEIHVSEPDGNIWKRLMQSNEMTAYLESQDLQDVRRNRQT